MSEGAARESIEKTVREEGGHVIAVLMSWVRDLDRAEDLLQDALVAALKHWGRTGIPDQPRAWLLTSARRRAIDAFRRRSKHEAHQGELRVMAQLQEQVQMALQEQDSVEVDPAVPDERLRLMFTCCHPALPEEARIALTLRTLGGLTTPEIARAFLVPEATMAQRLVRAKSKIRVAGIPYRVPDSTEWPERIQPVLASIYLIFNEGYAASTGDSLIRQDLCREAIRLGRILAELAPNEPEALGLTALMLLHDSRRVARTGSDGRMHSLEEQDRSIWSRDAIGEGLQMLDRARAFERPGRFQLQASISAVHAEAATFEGTDWNRIWQLYARLAAIEPSPVVELNALIALSFARGAEAVLPALDRMHDDGVLQDYQPFHAARADVLSRAGRQTDAEQAYRRAIQLSGNEAERTFLRERMRRRS